MEICSKENIILKKQEKEIDDEVRRLLNEAYQKAIDILNTHRNKLEAVTKVLLEKETIMGPEFEAIMEDENI